MAWPVPILEADWPGTNWQAFAFWQPMLDGSNLRLATLDTLGYTATARAFESAAPRLNRVASFRDLREKGFGYLKGVNWIDPDTAPVEGEVYSPVYYSEAAEWTQAFVDAVNAVLTSWSVPTMGSTILSGGAIPWTRKTGHADALATSHGDFEEGDVVGVWLFNEWRAALEVLTMLEHTAEDEDAESLVVSSGAGEENWSGSGDGDTCADAKDACEAAWADNASPSFETGWVRAKIETPTFAGVKFGAEYYREARDSQITWTPVTHGTMHAFVVASKVSAGDTFHNFGDPYEEGKVGHVESSATSPFAFNAPFRSSAGAGADIQDVTCPVFDGPTVYWSFMLGPIRAVVEMSYPDP